MSLDNSTPALRAISPCPTSPPSSSASRPPGPAATSPSSAPPCRSSANAGRSRPTSAPASACSTSPPATATPTLAAARRFADVTSTDYVPALLDKGSRARRAPKACRVQFQVADAEALPFDDGSFDVVLSTFGVMFAPITSARRREMLRVVRPGGRIGLANWTPQGFIGRLFKVIGAHVPPPAGLKSPALWGTEAHLAELFGARPRTSLRTAALQLPLPLGGALGAGVPRLLRPDAQGLRRARRAGPAGARARHHRAAAANEHGGCGLAGGAGRVPRSRDHQR